MVSLLGKVDVITYEFENIPMETVTCLSQFRPVRPKHTVLGNIHKYANGGSCNDGDDMDDDDDDDDDDGNDDNDVDFVQVFVRIDSKKNVL